MPDKPFVSLCVIHRRAGAGLARLVDSIRWNHEFDFDELVFLDTGPQDDDPQSEAARKLIAGLKQEHGDAIVVGSWQDDREIAVDGKPCITDFAAAREAAHAMATGTWTAFLDADDALQCGGDERFSDQLRKVILPAEPGAIALWAEYEYSSELYQPRTFCWLEAVGWAWRGRLHEERYLAAGGEISPVGPVARIIHGGDYHSSAARNIAILRELEQRGELDPKLRLALAGALCEDGLYDRAEPLLEDLKRTAVGTQQYKALLLLAEIARIRGDISRCRLLLGGAAVGFPAWRTAFVELGLLEEAAGNLEEARRHFLRAYDDPSTGESPMAVSRTREELAGRLSSARVLAQLGNAETALRRLDQIPDVFSGHPAVSGMELQVRRTEGDRRFAEAITATVRYLLAQDEVDRAALYLEALPHSACGLAEYREAVGMVRARSEHLANAGSYVELYSPVRKADLEGGSRRQEDQVAAVVQAVRDAGSPERCYILEVGCGTGWVIAEVARKVGGKVRCVGFDVGPRRVAVAREQYQDRKHLAFEVASVEDADFVAKATQALDGAAPHVVLMAEVLEHVACPEEVLGKLRRLLAPGGILVLTTPDAERYTELRPTACLLDLDASSYTRDREHVRLYDCHRLVEELESAGFEVESVAPADADYLDGVLLAATARPATRLTVVGPSRQIRGRLDIYAPSALEWGPRAHEEGFVGGSEQAVAHLAPLLAERGWDVHVFASVLDREHWHRGVFWHHLGRFDLAAARDVLVVWRDLAALARFSDRGAPCVLWAHDVPDEARRAVYDKARTILAVSPYHAGLFSEIVSEHVRVEVIGNGVAPAALPALPEASAELASDRDPHRAIYCSAASRGLLGLLVCWPMVRERVEDARLEVCYDLGLLRHPKTPAYLRGLADRLEHKMEALSDQGVTFHGGLPHASYLRLASRCGVWAYPTVFPEVYCIVAAEMQALGLIPVTTDKGALDKMVLAGSVMPWEDLAEELGLDDAQIAAGLQWDIDEEHCFSPTFVSMVCSAMEERPSRVRGRQLVSSGAGGAPPFGVQQDESGQVIPLSSAGWGASERLKLARLAVGSYDWARTAGATDRALCEHREKDPWPRPSPHRDLGSPRSPRSPWPRAPTRR